jgi:hypothetical protein
LIPVAVKISLGQEPIMSQVAQSVVEPIVMDPYEIGWYIESADEEIYGPISRKSLGRFLEEKTITPNTLVRHCTQPEARPAADQPTIMEGLNLDAPASAMGDRLAKSGIDKPWRKTRCRAPGIKSPRCWCAFDVVRPIAISAGQSPSASSFSTAGAARRTFITVDSAP